MKSSVVLSSALALGALSTQTSEHPIKRIIGLLDGLVSTAEQEGKDEALAYDKFAHWCVTSIKTVTGAIDGENQKISMLTSQIAGEEKLIAQLTEQIGKLEKEISDAENAAERAKDMRKDGADLYAKVSADHKATIKAIGDAQAALENSQDGGAALLQLDRPEVRRILAMAVAVWPTGVPETHRAALTSFLQDRPDQLAEGDRAAHVQSFKFKSGSVIELLKALKTQFEDELIATDKAETNSLNGYNLEKQARDAAIAAAEKSKEEKETTKGDTEESMGAHKQSLKDEEEDLAADSSTLKETEKSCAMKKQEWTKRSNTRKLEIEAMEMATGILAKATGVSTEAPSNPVPPPSPASFLQIASDSAKPVQRAVNLLREKARITHSKALLRMAQELSAHMDDPFGKVNNMIEKMIFQLMNEQTDEDNHKDWCDQEMEKTNTSKVQKKTKVEELTAKIDEATGHAAQLTSDIEAADAMVAEIVAFVKEATEIRYLGKKENAKATEDAQDAQKAVADAVAVLTQFYKESGMVEKESWEFVQRKVDLPENPETWDAGYTGVADPKAQPGGIITVMEKIGADFAEMEADTRAQEAEDQKAFDEELSAQAIEKAERTQESKSKGQERGRVVNKLTELKDKNKHVAGELYAVEQYWKDLGPACYEGDSTYEERKAARASEIEGLKQAEGILATAFDEPAPTMLLKENGKGKNNFLAKH
jgi:peptidoglycan hydrolase CwlO-like protein